MKSLKTTKIGLLSTWFSAVVFYVIYVAVTLGVSFLARAWGGRASGMEMGGGSGIFLFIVGIMTVRSLFYFTQSNCVSRKSYYQGFLLFMVLLAAAFAVLDIAVNRVLPFAATHPFTLSFYKVYPKGNILGEFVYTLVGGLSRLSFGALISMIYYRLNVVGKWIFSVIGVLGVTLVPTMGVLSLPHNVLLRLAEWIAKLAEFYFTSPYHGSLVMLIGVAAAVTVCYLFVRRATVKESQ